MESRARLKLQVNLLDWPVWYENPFGMIIRPTSPTFVARTECHITCLLLSVGKIIM